MATRLALGLVGVGRIGVLHARTLLALEGVSLTVADADSGRARKVAAELGIEAAETPEELVAAGVDGARDRNLDRRTRAPRAPGRGRLGAGVLREARRARPRRRWTRWSQPPTRAGILVQVGFQRRFDAGYRALRDAVANGSVGRILVDACCDP